MIELTTAFDKQGIKIGVWLVDKSTSDMIFLDLNSLSKIMSFIKEYDPENVGDFDDGIYENINHIGITTVNEESSCLVILDGDESVDLNYDDIQILFTLL